MNLYYQDAQAVVLVYDITNVGSFENLSEWVNEIDEKTENRPLIFLCGNKSDNQEECEVEIHKASEFAKSIGSKIYETSAKEGTGIDRLFQELSNKLYSRYIEMLNNERVRIVFGL